MPTNYDEIRIDHEGKQLPEGVYALARPDGSVASYRARWREEDGEGILRQRSQAFNQRKCGTLAAAREQAVVHRAGAVEIAARGETVLRPDRAAKLTVGQLFKEWVIDHAAVNCSERHATESIRTWDRLIEPRLGRVRLSRLADEPEVISRFGSELVTAHVPASVRHKALGILKTVLRWGRRRYPRTLTSDVTDLFEMPRSQRRRLIRAADPVSIERIIEAVWNRDHHKHLYQERNVALVAAMGFTVAARPGEWLHSVTWADLHDTTVELQAIRTASGIDAGEEAGMKTGARAALLLPNARDRILDYRRALEARHGPQPEHGLVFQQLGKGGVGPLWMSDGTPVPWSIDQYKHWVSRVWGVVRERAAKAPDAEDWISTMTFYELRHSTISLALHAGYASNLHLLGAYAGHDVLTMQRHYSHLIARYRDATPVDLGAECEAARTQVEAQPFIVE